LKSLIIAIATTLSILLISILIAPTPTTQYNLYVPNPYGDGIGAPHNVVHFPNGGYEWTVSHGD